MVQRVKAKILGDSLDFVEVPATKLPLRARGFLRYVPKNCPYDELFIELRNGEVLIWVQERPHFGPKKDKGAG